MQYLEQPILNCLCFLLTGLKSYFCFVSLGLGDWSKLFYVFERWTCFAFFHPPLLWKQLMVGNLLLVQTTDILLSWAGSIVPGPVLGSIEPVLHQGVLCQDVHCVLAQKSNTKHQTELFKTLVLYKTWCFSSVMFHTRALVSSPSYK